MVEPYFRRLVLRSVAHIIRLYSSSLITECEVHYAKLYLFIVDFVLLTTKEQAHETCSSDDYDICKFFLLMCVHPISFCAGVPKYARESYIFRFAIVASHSCSGDFEGNRYIHLLLLAHVCNTV